MALDMERGSRGLWNDDVWSGKQKAFGHLTNERSKRPQLA